MKQNCWVVISPFDHVVAIALTPEEAIKAFEDIDRKHDLNPSPWNHYASIGFRCQQVRLNIDEINKGGSRE